MQHNTVKERNLAQMQQQNNHSTLKKQENNLLAQQNKPDYAWYNPMGWFA